LPGRPDPRLATPALCLVTDRRLVPEPVAAVKAAVAGGVNLVQVREKDLSAGELLALVRRLRVEVGGRAKLVVNDRVDVALAAGADGVHLPEAGLPVAEARRLLGPGPLLGASVHSVRAAVAAERAGADYLIAGPIYPTRSHPGAPAAGPELVRQVRASTRLPVLAIGGITAANAAEARMAGADGLAVISAILAAVDPERAAAGLCAALAADQGKFPSCHPERSEGSRPRVPVNAEILRSAPDDSP
jgi:thiamine-phosphate pyrophosphorylase